MSIDTHAVPASAVSPETQRFASTLPYVGMANGFTPDELDWIVAQGDRIGYEKADTLTGAYRPAVSGRLRVSQTAWMQRGPEVEWVYARLQQLIASVNAQVYQMELTGFAGPMQYAAYHAAEGGHFSWHTDQGPLNVQRKLSLTLQLSDPADYDGGDLEFMVRDQPDVAPRERGVLVAFPSYTLHRVTPVTRGVRRSIVIWTTGPKFR